MSTSRVAAGLTILALSSTLAFAPWARAIDPAKLPPGATDTPGEFYAPKLKIYFKFIITNINRADVGGPTYAAEISQAPTAGGPAAAVGLEKGDLILELGGSPFVLVPPVVFDLPPGGPHAI